MKLHISFTVLAPVSSSTFFTSIGPVFAYLEISCTMTPFPAGCNQNPKFSFACGGEAAAQKCQNLFFLCLKEQFTRCMLVPVLSIVLVHCRVHEALGHFAHFEIEESEVV